MASVGLAQLGPAAETASDITTLMGDEDRFGLARSANQSQGFKFGTSARGQVSGHASPLAFAQVLTAWAAVAFRPTCARELQCRVADHSAWSAASTSGLGVGTGAG